MRSLLLLGLLLAGCHSEPELGPPLSDLAGVYSAPKLVNRPAAVLFWLETADTLPADSTSDAIEHLRLLAEGLGRVLAGSNIPVLATHASRILIGGKGRPRRAVTLSGLDYPWGVMLVDPGYPEQIITGPVDSEDVEDLAWSYFELEHVQPNRDQRRIAGRQKGTGETGFPRVGFPLPLPSPASPWFIAASISR
jgi:hypothetical protein